MQEFVLPNDAFEKFPALRETYQKKKHVDLSAKPSWVGLPILLGGTDVTTRNEQILFLEKMRIALNPNLLLAEKGNSLEERQAQLTATPEQRHERLSAKREMFAATLYVLDQLKASKNNSTLYRILKSNVGITKTNFPNQKLKETCFLAAKRRINQPNAFIIANAELERNNLPPFTEQEWEKFSKFLTDKCANAAEETPKTNYPFTKAARTVLGAGFGYAGATAGALLGELACQSTHAVSSQYQMTPYLSRILLVGLSPAAVLLFAPVIMGKLINTYCAISLAHILGSVMSIAGEGVGIAAGMPLDISVHVLQKICSTINGYITSAQAAGLTGLQLADGKFVYDGMIIELIDKAQLSPEQLPDDKSQPLKILLPEPGPSPDGKVDPTKFQVTPEILKDILARLNNPQLINPEIVRDKEMQHLDIPNTGTPIPCTTAPGII